MDAYCYSHLRNRDISLLMNIDCLFLFHNLLLTWNSKFLWKQPYKSLQLGWCLLRNDVIKVGNFLFVWTLIVAIWTVAVDINFKLLVKRAIYEPTITLLIAFGVIKKYGNFCFAWSLFFYLFKKILRTFKVYLGTSRNL